MPPLGKTSLKRTPPKVPKDAYRFSDEDLAQDQDFQRTLADLSSGRDGKILASQLSIKSPLGPFVIPCIYQKNGQGPTILVSQPDYWDAIHIKNFFSYVCRVRTTSEYISMPIVHAQQKDVPKEVDFLSRETPPTLLAVDARVFYRTDPSEREEKFSAHAEDFSKILQHYADFKVSFLPETLAHLDQLIQKWYVDGKHDYQCLGALKNMLAFFYGDVFVRNQVGGWLARKLDGNVTTIWIDTGSCRYNVIGKVWKAFKYGTEEESLAALYQSALLEVSHRAA